MLFDISTTYNKDAVLEFHEILNRTIRCKRIRTVRIVTIVVAAACFIYALLWAFVNFDIIPVLFGIVFGCAFLALSFNYEKFTNQSGRSLVTDPPITEHYVFGKDGYQSGSCGKMRKNQYGIIGAVCENENFYVVMIGHNRGFLLDKRNFKKGNPEDFHSFIEEKTGREIQPGFK